MTSSGQIDSRAKRGNDHNTHGCQLAAVASVRLINKFMTSSNSTESILFTELAKLGLAKAWTALPNPREAMELECQKIKCRSGFSESLSNYLNQKPIITQSLDSVIQQLAFSAGIDWKNASDILKPSAQRGWHFGRWLPTFLVVDGPLGMLLRDSQSPIALILRENHADFPLLCSARDAFNHKKFRLVRNGFAHWSLVWCENEGTTNIQIYDWNSGELSLELTLLQAEAMHFMSANIVQTIGEKFLR